ncbi:MAG: dihydrofolate reductase [Candidatus Sumerlaeia bacterium]|nr:dihydrofolate reductase [Candidatus Sumerlaeia bacterium]
MATFAIYIAQSLDGFIAADDGSVEWLDHFSSFDYGFDQFLDGVGTLVMGRRTYDQILTFGEWPYGQHPAVVVTSKPLHAMPGANVRAHHGDLKELVASLSARDELVWIVGGAELIAGMIAAGAAPRLELHIMPILMGSGVPLWKPHATRGRYRLVRKSAYDNGVVSLNYVPMEQP